MTRRRGRRVIKVGGLLLTLWDHAHLMRKQFADSILKITKRGQFIEPRAELIQSEMLSMDARLAVPHRTEKFGSSRGIKALRNNYGVILRPVFNDDWPFFSG